MTLVVVVGAGFGGLAARALARDGVEVVVDANNGRSSSAGSVGFPGGSQ